MSERVRGALFNMLGNLDGLTVLDAFAGSGALSLEAVSRGATHATAIDIDKAAMKTVATNAQKLGITDHIKSIRASASGWSDNNPSATFDIVFAAPPYDDLQPALVKKLIRHVAPNGLFVLDWPGKLTLLDTQDIENIAVKNYGDAQIAIYRKPS